MTKPKTQAGRALTYEEHCRLCGHPESFHACRVTGCDCPAWVAEAAAAPAALRRVAEAAWDWWENGWGGVEGSTPEYTCMTVQEQAEGERVMDALRAAIDQSEPAAAEPPDLLRWDDPGLASKIPTAPLPLDETRVIGAVSMALREHLYQARLWHRCKPNDCAVDLGRRVYIWLAGSVDE